MKVEELHDPTAALRRKELSHEEEEEEDEEEEAERDFTCGACEAGHEGHPVITSCDILTLTEKHSSLHTCMITHTHKV